MWQKSKRSFSSTSIAQGTRCHDSFASWVVSKYIEEYFGNESNFTKKQLKCKIYTLFYDVRNAHQIKRNRDRSGSGDKNPQQSKQATYSKHKWKHIEAMKYWLSSISFHSNEIVFYLVQMTFSVDNILGLHRELQLHLLTQIRLGCSFHHGSRPYLAISCHLHGDWCLWFVIQIRKAYINFCAGLTFSIRRPIVWQTTTRATPFCKLNLSARFMKFLFHLRPPQPRMSVFSAFSE